MQLLRYRDPGGSIRYGLFHGNGQRGELLGEPRTAERRDASPLIEPCRY